MQWDPIEENTDNVSILLKYENGSNAVINYFSNGSKGYSKERVEVYSQELTLLDNWRKLKGYGFKDSQVSRLSKIKDTLINLSFIRTAEKGSEPVLLKLLIKRAFLLPLIL